MPKQKLKIGQKKKVYFNAPEILLKDFAKVAEANGFEWHEALRQALREFIDEWGFEEDKAADTIAKFFRKITPKSVKPVKLVKPPEKQALESRK